MADKIYCGNARFIKTTFGELLKISLSASDLEKLQNNLANGWVNAVVKAKKEPAEGKPTHYLEIDTWKSEDKGAAPAQAQQPAAQNTSPAPASASTGDDDLPF